ncbi:hypothetical protein DPMN_148852 [Dreissena polymorpha]|uniref:Uncharacterized protein n=1 Tax=Dreissena polymorpha TaxID=45954 RepID=A0A9D4FGC5_DREPO|nr:hypothetical protein DPMN_148852 [Dreissena polymorpha]
MFIDQVDELAHLHSPVKRYPVCLLDHDTLRDLMVDRGVPDQIERAELDLRWQHIA